MLAATRKFAKSWFAAILLGLLIVSFAVFGIGDVFRANNSDAVITAGERTVNSADFRRVFDSAKADVEQRGGQPITVETAVENGLDKRLLEDLASGEAFAELLRRIGVRASDKLVADRIGETSAFFDPITRKFDKAIYATRLGERQLTPEKYEGFLRDEIGQNHFVAAIGSGLRTPRIYSALNAAYGLEQRDMGFFVVGPNNVAKVPTPTDAQITAFMKENAGQLTRPEFRQLTVVRFSPAAFQGAVAIDPAELQKRFDFKKDTLSTPERRTVIQIPAKDAAAAAAIAARLAKGEEPAAAARASGSEPLVYDDKPKSAIVDRRVADAAFALKEGQVSPPVKGELGLSIVKVVKIIPGRTVTLAEIRPQLEAELRADLAAEKVYEVSKVYEDTHAGGANLRESAAKAGVPTVAVGPVTATGQLLGGQVSKDLDPRILKVAFTLPEGGESDVEEIGKGEYFVVRVEKIIPPALPPLAEVKGELSRVYVLRKTAELMRARADQLAERLRKGESLEAVASSIGARVIRIVDINRATAQRHQALGGDLLGGAFAAKKGDVFIGQTPQFGFAVARMENIRNGDPELMARVTEAQRQEATMRVFQDIGASVRRFARAEVKATTSLDRARSALGLDPTQFNEQGKPVDKAAAGKAK